MLPRSELIFTDLPGGDLLAAGLEDLRRGVESVPDLVAQIGAPRLRQLAIPSSVETGARRRRFG